MMNKINILATLSLLMSATAFSQSNSLSSSPYSLYGMGSFNTTNTGKTASLGYTGIASSSSESINNLNPASMASIPLNTFFFDMGMKSEYGFQIDGGTNESKFIANFSDVALAFPLTKKSGVSITLIPYTNVGYSISNLESDIEGAASSFTSDIEGSGGLNDFKLNYGYALLDNLSVGVSGSVLFGQIIEQETNYIGTNVLDIYESNSYSGLQVGFGTQYKPFETVTLGAVVTLPTNLSGDQIRDVSQLYDSDISTEENLDDFKLPLEVGFGIQTRFLDQVNVALDYKKKYWTDTNQTDQLGTFVDQNLFGLSVEFDPNGNQLKYKNRMQYRAGLTYDTGNLEINDKKISNYALSLGLGIPISYNTVSMLNLAYSYGKKGQIYDGIIQENYHMLTLNISLAGRWFQKRMIQ
ncbi:conserved hypothetical protein [Formosa agariphila KMM 3901]|uniref:Outer membrane protein n=1 Tax=Formosa agariphila (strain DSM 15362 / KCTC 12365 / LMG 23005 / KMM 3901 / M-2Alg 35-1) TaxID=1347342 RepID=T2KLQ1_FORAG|nr:hypothetical protein [Formosa agariphila]CDF79383.1 conserved hypothetical protein [Formosa agariphila KMM 3901]